MKKIYLILGVILAMAACQKPEPEQPGGGNQPVEPEQPEHPVKSDYTITATAPSTWEVDQTIGLVAANVNKESAKLAEGNITENGSKGSFTFSDMAKGDYLAYFPYNAENAAGKVSFSVPASQDGTPVLSYISVKDNGFGPVTFSDGDTPVEVTFKALGAVLKLAVYGGESGEVMTALSVKAASSTICGTVTYGADGAVSGETANPGLKVHLNSLNYSADASEKPQDVVKVLVLPVEIAASEAANRIYTVTTAKGDYAFKIKDACTWAAGEEYEIDLDLSQADTKPTDTPVTADYTLNVTTPSTWAADQKIGLVNAASNTESSALTAGNITENGSKGAFSFTNMNEGDYLAYYPFSAGNNVGVTFTVEASQNGSFVMPLLSSSNGIYAPVTLESTSASVDVTMKAVGAVLNFKVYGGPAGETMSSITVEGSDNLAGAVTYDMDGVLTGTASASATVTVSANQSVSAAEAPAEGVKALVLPLNAGTVTYTVTTDKGNYVFKSNEACTWAAGTENNIVLNLGEATEDPYDPYDWRDFVDVTGVNVPAYTFLPATPEANSNRAKLDAQKSAAASEASDERKATAASDMDLSVAGILSTFSAINGVSLSTDNTDLVSLMKVVLAASRKACPNEYPSSVAASGWAVALLLAQLDYTHQTEILQVGLRIGESAVLTGNTTYSAAHTGQIVASMLVSSLRSNAAFAKTLDKLMESAPKSTGYPSTADDFANSYTYLPAHPVQNHDADNYAMLYDQERFDWGVTQRSTARGEQANKDNDYSGTYMRRQYYGPVIGYQVSSTNSNKFYTAVQSVFNDHGVTKAKEGYDRERPFEFFGGTNTVEKPAGEGKSYPSGHAHAGFVTGLLYAEIAPELAGSFYERGYEYGISRVIVGVHYQSDVDAAILTAAAAMSRYHASQAFINDLKKAKTEYNTFKHRKDDNNNPYIGIGYGDNDEEFK